MNDRYRAPATINCPVCLGPMFQRPELPPKGYSSHLRLFVHNIERSCRVFHWVETKPTEKRPGLDTPDLSKLQKPC